ncbi:MAG: YggS family pyridoxal phosphate-dependent enzyme [Planctomycetia bacterium]|nr:YggS family pyridoxal phosphate-dependent enzyme [Planctomycetia bacterium]
MQTPSEYRAILAGKVHAVQHRIVESASRAGRDAKDVTIVAVTKYALASDPLIPALLELGLVRLGENRIPMLLDKRAAFGPDIGGESRLTPVPQWHFIGSLQRNKVRKILPFVTMIHSIDSERLLDAVDRIAAEEDIKSERSALGLPQRVPVLLEVNIGGEATKHGFDPAILETLMPQLLRYTNVEISGLMGMARLDADERETRREFCMLNTLSQTVRKYATETHPCSELSMGMSGDFQCAVECGATLVRLGSLLYP